MNAANATRLVRAAGEATLAEAVTLRNKPFFCVCACVSMQVSMSLYGFDVPCGKNGLAVSRRQKIYDIIAPYVLSAEDMKEIAEAPRQLKELWLESLANTNRTMVHTNTQRATKELLRKAFPSKDLVPSRRFRVMLGLEDETSVLHRQAFSRYVLFLAHHVLISLIVRAGGWTPVEQLCMTASFRLCR